MISDLEHFQMVKAKRALVALTSGGDHQTRFRSYKHLLMSFWQFLLHLIDQEGTVPENATVKKYLGQSQSGRSIVKLKSLKILLRMVTYPNSE